MVRVRVLGSVSVDIDGQPVDLPPGRPTEVLAWLAVHPGRHARARVAAVFWPEVTDSSARASLRTALWALRKALGARGEAVLILDRDTVSLDGSDLWVDLRQRDSWSVEEAMSVDPDDLLRGLDTEWADQERDDHRAAVIGLLGSIGEEAEATGAVETAAQAARRLTEMDPFSEEHHRLLVRRLVAAGDRATATREHQKFRQRLQDELGVPPSPTTVDVVKDVLARSDEPPVPVPVPIPSRLERLDQELMVGRDAEQRCLGDEWSACRRHGGTRVVFIEGDAGMGKTRLLAKFAVRVRDDGGAVLFGAALEDQLVPAEPFLEAVEEHQNLGSEALMSAVRRRVDGATSQSPTALLLDDFQWADSLSFAVLRRLIRWPARNGLLVVVALRVEGEPDAKVMSLVADVAREVPVARITLVPLSLPATASLLADLDTTGRLADRAEGIHRDTQGNPFFVRELGRYLVERPDTPGSLTPVPDTIRELVAARLDPLSPLGTEVVSVAAVLGARVTVPVLQRMFPGEEVLTGVEEVVAAGLMEEEDVGLHAFRHALVRSAVYDALSRSRRAELHRQAADALRAVHGEGDGIHLCDIAEHRCAALPVDSPSAAAADARRAGRWAIDHHAHDRAVVTLTKALQACEQSARQELAVLRAIAFQRLTHDVIDATGT